ncbi:MAG TPA: hypothetical protein VH723_03530 [Candidatus Limnocylindrales bacterium]
MLRRRLSVAATAALLVLSMAVPAANAAAVTHWVNDDDPNGGAYVPPGTSCNNPGYARIQDAVIAAGPGDTINVCPGTYPEEVKILPGDDGITLRSVVPLAAVIRAPAVMTPPANAIVHVAGAQDVRILGFRITGPGPGGCNSIGVGVLVNLDGSALIAGNHVTNIRDEPFGGCQNGIGVQVGSFTASGDVSTPGRATIVFNVIDRYQKGGVIVNEPGSYGRVENNVLRGVGPSPAIAQNGIQIGFHASADVLENLVSGHSYTGVDDAIWDSAGILLTDLAIPDTVVVSGNRVSRNDIGIWLSGSGNTPDPEGFGPTLSQRVSRNQSRDNRFDGIFADEFTAANQIRANTALGNDRFDCHDEAPPAVTTTVNIWRENTGETQNKPNLCRDRGHRDGDDHHGKPRPWRDDDEHDD